MVRLAYAREMTKRREMFIKQKFPSYKFVTIQECEFEKMNKQSNYGELLKEVNEEISTTFIPPRSFYFGGIDKYFIFNYLN